MVETKLQLVNVEQYEDIKARYEHAKDTLFIEMNGTQVQSWEDWIDAINPKIGFWSDCRGVDTPRMSRYIDQMTDLDFTVNKDVINSYESIIFAIRNGGDFLKKATFEEKGDIYYGFVKYIFPYWQYQVIPTSHNKPKNIFVFLIGESYKAGCYINSWDIRGYGKYRYTSGELKKNSGVTVIDIDVFGVRKWQEYIHILKDKLWLSAACYSDMDVYESEVLEYIKHHEPNRKIHFVLRNVAESFIYENRDMSEAWITGFIDVIFPECEKRGIQCMVSLVDYCEDYEYMIMKMIRDKELSYEDILDMYQ